MIGTYLANIFGLGTGEIVIIAVVVLILFGPKQLPGLGRSIGQFYREIKKGTTDEPTESKPEEKK
ncbi:MAG: Sec-independent protein translocase subunit TatA/TatB [bacterium]